jgi:FixJ family two-component response regulator
MVSPSYTSLTTTRRQETRWFSCCSTASYSVRDHESARAFLDAIATAEAGCIITDIRMPEIGGLDLLRRPGISASDGR